jgi:hypothetical protein
MKMGKVRFIIEYAVDLDKPEQIDVATEFIYEDVDAAVKYNETDGYIETEEDSSLTYDDIHTGILELTEEDEEEEDD